MTRVHTQNLVSTKARRRATKTTRPVQRQRVLTNVSNHKSQSPTPADADPSSLHESTPEEDHMANDCMDPDEATLSRTFQNLKDPYLRLVVGVLLRNHKNKRQEQQQQQQEEEEEEEDVNKYPWEMQCKAQNFVENCYRQLDEANDNDKDKNENKNDKDKNDEDKNNNEKNINNNIYPSTICPEADPSVVSELTNVNLSTNCLSHHRLIECDEDVGYTIQTSNGTCRTGKRRARGTCRNCKRKTKWFCPMCQGTHGAKRAWFCHTRNNPVCQQMHLEKVELSFSERLWWE